MLNRKLLWKKLFKRRFVKLTCIDGYMVNNYREIRVTKVRRTVFIFKDYQGNEDWLDNKFLKHYDFSENL